MFIRPNFHENGLVNFGYGRTPSQIMILQLSFFIGSLLALTYRKGETFSYSYSTMTVHRSQKSSNDDGATTVQLDTQANFKVISTSSDGAFIEMTVQNVTGDISDETDKESISSTHATEKVWKLEFFL
jgi:hypothetical protein